MHALSSVPKLRDLNIKVLGEHGKSWLTLALDPFHDNPVRCEGFPDRTSEATIVEPFLQSFTLSAPAGTVDTWGFHLFTTPYVAISNVVPVDVYPTARVVGELFNTQDNGANICSATQLGYQTATPRATSAIPTSFLNVWAWDTDVSTVFPSGDGTFTYPSANYRMGEIGEYQARVIGAGIEVVNTTATLFQQGQVTVSRTSTNRMQENANSWVGNAASQNIYTVGAMLRGDCSTVGFESSYGPPTSQAIATSHAQTKIWKAADGCYSVVSFDIDAMRTIAAPSRVGRALNTTSQALPPLGVGLNDIQLPNGISTPSKLYDTMGIGGVSSTAAYAQAPALTVASDCTSMIFSGLSKQSTFTITLRLILEKAPRYYDVGGRDLTRLATPSAAYDPVALEIYRDAIAALPVGVPSKFNPLGEYWNWLVGAVKKVAPIISGVAGVIPLPQAQLVAQVANIASKAALAASAAGGARAAASSSRQPPAAAAAPSAQRKRNKQKPPAKRQAVRKPTNKKKGK